MLASRTARATKHDRVRAWWGAPVDLGGAYPTGAPSVIVRDTVKIKVLYSGLNSHVFLTEYDGATR